MSPSIQKMGFFMSEINFCNTKEQLNHLGEVVTGKVSGSPTGAEIETSTLPYTGQVRKTLPALEQEYISAIQSAGGDALNNGAWAAGQTFTAYNQYMVYNSVPYKPKTTTTLPYGPTGSTPDENFVQPFTDVTRNDLDIVSRKVAVYAASSTSDMVIGKHVHWVDSSDDVTPLVGDTWLVDGKTWVRQSASSGDISDFSQVDRLEFDTVQNMIDSINGTNTEVYDGMHCSLSNYYTGDDANHKRKISASNDGSGVALANGMFANLVLPKGETLKASSLGWVSGGDYTSILDSSLIPYLESKEITCIKLDTGDVKYTGTFDFFYSAVTFEGEGKLQTDNLDNMIQRVESKIGYEKQYQGEYNTGSIYNQAFMQAAIVRGDVKVVLLGDSISVGDDYDSFGVAASGVIGNQGVDNQDRHDCLAAQMYTELVACLPSTVRVRFYSRSIGGLGYSSLNLAWDSIGGLFSGREQATSGKSWRDCVLDLNPDLVIHSMGMNEKPNTYVDQFLVNWDSYLDAEQKQNTFDQVVLTTPNPNFFDAAAFGDFRDYDLNASKFYVASSQRYMARFKGYSLIDVATCSYIKRYGFDPRSCTYRADESTLTFKDGTTSKVIVPGSNVTNTEFTPEYLPIYSSTTVNFTPSVSSSTAGFDFKINAGSVILQFTGGNVNLYTGIYTYLASSKSVVYELQAGVNYEMTVTVTNAGVFVYNNNDNSLLIVNNEAIYSATLPLHFENSGGSQNVTVNSGIVRGQQFARYSADTRTNGEIYGNISPSLNKYGGGINHPSTVGLSEVYLPPVREFFKSLVRAASPVVPSVIGGTTANEGVYIGRVNPVNYSKVSVKDYGSGLDLSLQILVDQAGVISYTVISNPNVGISIYFDPSDGAVFAKNSTATFLQIEHEGSWLSKQVKKLGSAFNPRGTFVPTT